MYNAGPAKPFEPRGSLKGYTTPLTHLSTSGRRMRERPVFTRRVLTNALGLEAAPGEVGQACAGDGALEKVALPAAEVHRAADLEGT